MFDFKVYAKSIAAFVAGVIANMVTDLVGGTAPWPQSGAEWLRYALTSFGAALAAYGVPNKITQKQIDKQPDIIGAVVLPAVADRASEAAQAAVINATKDIPVAGNVVKDVTERVGSVVDQVIRDFQNRAR